MGRNCRMVNIDGGSLREAIHGRGMSLIEAGDLIGKSSSYFSTAIGEGKMSLTSWEYFLLKLKDKGMELSPTEYDDIRCVKKKPVSPQKDWVLETEEEGGELKVTLFVNGIKQGSGFGYIFSDGLQGWLQAYSYATHQLYKNLYE